MWKAPRFISRLGCAENGGKERGEVREGRREEKEGRKGGSE
jgi:hypothetical protein